MARGTKIVKNEVEPVIKKGIKKTQTKTTKPKKPAVPTNAKSVYGDDNKIVGYYLENNEHGVTLYELWVFKGTKPVQFGHTVNEKAATNRIKKKFSLIV